MLSPISQQFLMKYAPEAINAEDRKSHEDIILKYLDEDPDFKYKACNFFLGKNKDINLTDFDEYHTLSSPSLSEIERSGKLAEFRRFESEVFGAGQYFIVGNDVTVDEIPFTQKSSIGYAIRLQEAGGIPQDISDIDHFIRANGNAIHLRGIVNNIPSAITIMDVGAFLMGTIGSFSENHIRTLAPCHYEEDLFIDDDGYEMIKQFSYYENDLHSDRFIAILNEKIYRQQLAIIDEMVDSIDDNIKIIDSYYNGEVDMSRITIVVKNLDKISDLSIHNLFDGATSDSTNCLDDVIEKSNGKALDMIDSAFVELEQEEKEHREKFKKQEEDRAKGIVDFSQKKISLDYLQDHKVISVDDYEMDQTENEEQLFSVHDFY